MGKASRRKRDRRAVGMNQADVKGLRVIYDIAETIGGTMKLTVGEAAGEAHWVVIDTSEPPAALCGLVVGLGPSEAKEPTCENCKAIPRRQLQDTQMKIEVANKASMAQIRATLGRLGG